MSIKLNKLNKTIIKCKKCPRLSSFIKKISKEKRKQNIDEKYWGKPVTGLPQYLSLKFCLRFSFDIFFTKLVNRGHFLHLTIVLFKLSNLILINENF